MQINIVTNIIILIVNREPYKMHGQRPSQQNRVNKQSIFEEEKFGITYANYRKNQYNNFENLSVIL